MLASILQNEYTGCISEMLGTRSFSDCEFFQIWEYLHYTYQLNISKLKTQNLWVFPLSVMSMLKKFRILDFGLGILNLYHNLFIVPRFLLLWTIYYKHYGNLVHTCKSFSRAAVLFTSWKLLRTLKSFCLCELYPSVFTVRNENWGILKTLTKNDNDKLITLPLITF